MFVNIAPEGKRSRSGSSRALQMSPCTSSSSISSGACPNNNPGPKRCTCDSTWTRVPRWAAPSPNQTFDEVSHEWSHHAPYTEWDVGGCVKSLFAYLGSRSSISSSTLFSRPRQHWTIFRTEPLHLTVGACALAPPRIPLCRKMPCKVVPWPIQWIFGQSLLHVRGEPPGRRGPLVSDDGSRIKSNGTFPDSLAISSNSKRASWKGEYFTSMAKSRKWNWMVLRTILRCWHRQHAPMQSTAEPS